MGIAVSLILSAVGLVLALAVHPSGTHSVNVNTVGWILFVLGLVGLLLDLLLWSERGPGYMRRAAIERGSGYPSRRARGARRTVIEEDEVPPDPPPDY